MDNFFQNKKSIFVITYAIVLAYVVFNFKQINSWLLYFIDVLSPLIYGLVFAFLIGLIAKIFFKFISKYMKNEKKANTISIILAYIFFLGFIGLFLAPIIRQLNTSINDIKDKLPVLYEYFNAFINNAAYKFGLTTEQLATISQYLLNVYNNMYSFLYNKLPDIIAYAFSFVNFIKNLGFGLIISIYILFTKDTLSIQVKKIVLVIFPEKYALIILSTISKANVIFKSYISGQIIVSLILGAVCFLCMTVLKMPYALLVSIIMCVTNIVPIVGPIIGAIPATIIVMIKDPKFGIWFIILDIVLQQLESNLLCPKIIGESVGMSGLWVMIAIVIGGGLFGIVGMIVAVPTMGVIYALSGEFFNKKYNNKYNNKYDKLLKKR